jgi:hypothetical protein
VKNKEDVLRSFMLVSEKFRLSDTNMNERNTSFLKNEGEVAIRDKSAGMSRGRSSSCFGQ